MTVVDIREFENLFSEYVRLVREGESVIVTDCGVVVAELRPRGSASIKRSDPIIGSLVRRGNVTVAAPNRPDLYPLQPSVTPPGTAEKLLDEEREDH